METKNLPYPKTFEEPTNTWPDITKPLIGIQIPERKDSDNWGIVSHYNYRSVVEKFSERIYIATSVLNDSIEINIKKLGGVPVIKGTRFSVAQLFSQIADGDNVTDIAENFELDQDKLHSLLHAMAAFLDRPLYK